MSENETFGLELQQAVEDLVKNIDQYSHSTLGDEDHQVIILSKPAEIKNEKVYLLFSKQLGTRTLRFNQGHTLSTAELEPLFHMYLKKELEIGASNRHQDPIVLRQGGGLYQAGENLKVNIGEFPISPLNLNLEDLEQLKTSNKKENLLP